MYTHITNRIAVVHVCIYIARVCVSRIAVGLVNVQLKKYNINGLSGVLIFLFLDVSADYRDVLSL